jgi:methyltransferase (TIGR00027 family)
VVSFVAAEEQVTSVRNISETALWVAIYRARETERPDAVFRDPFARRLAGTRGEEIANSLPFAQKANWSFVARTVLFDDLILKEVERGADMVVNLAAGLDARPYRLQLPPELQWIEVDLPGMIDYKESILRDAKPSCRVERVRLDLADVDARRALFAELGARAKRAVIVTEGLIVYLSREDVASLARDLAAPATFQRWINDIGSPGLLKLLRKNMAKTLDAGGAILQFAPEEGPPFFKPYGWKPLQVCSLIKSAAKLRRLSFFMRLVAMLPESDTKQGSSPWAAVCLFGRR